MNALYNNTPSLFTGLKGLPEWADFQVIDGHIYSPKNGCVARCKDNAEAEKVLTDAGFSPDEKGKWN